MKHIEWINITDKLPEINEHVLLIYYKGKKSWRHEPITAVTQGYLDDRGIWYDYSDRQLYCTGAPTTKNRVIAWTKLELPKFTVG